MNAAQTQIILTAAQQNVLALEREVKTMGFAFEASMAAIKGQLQELRETLRAPAKQL